MDPVALYEGDENIVSDDMSEELKTPATLVGGAPKSSNNSMCADDMDSPALSNGAVKSNELFVFQANTGNEGESFTENYFSDSHLDEAEGVDPFDCSWCDSSVNVNREHNLVIDNGDTVTLKSNSSMTCLPDATPVDISDCSSASTSLPTDAVTVGYSKLRDSAPSSICSASPFESPTHVACASNRSDTGSLGYDDSINTRPDSLCLQRSVLQQRERQWLIAKKGSYSSLSECDSSRSGSMDALIEAATSTPLHAQGTVTVDGDMITFVADGINELIKRSHRDSFTENWTANQTPRSHSSGSVSSSTSGWSASALSASGYSQMTRSPSVHSPEDIPPIDCKAIDDLEQHARKVACSLDTLMETLTNKLFKISTLSHSCLSVYTEAVDNTCEVVDTSIKSMYALMAKCEELSRTVQPVYEIKDQIREIKRLLDLFEAQSAAHD